MQAETKAYVSKKYYNVLVILTQIQIFLYNQFLFVMLYPELLIRSNISFDYR